MAEEDRAPSGLKREERLAELLVQRFALSPPVDVRGVAAKYADVEYDRIPGSCDGLVLGLQGQRKRPLILVDRSSHDTRQRFTLAHELGHVLLPWHLGGSFTCNTTADLWEANFDEPEANRFAAELLVPGEWLDGLIDARGDDLVRPLVQAVLGAGVSTWVASFRLAERLPAGHVFAVVDSTGHVSIAGQTAGTSIQPPRRGEPLERARLDRFASEAEDIQSGTRRIIWWTFRQEPTGEFTIPEGTAREVLAGLAERYAEESSARPAQIIQSCNGVTGYAFDIARRARQDDPEQLYVRFRARFATTRELPPGFLDDPDFDSWLRLRASEMGR